MSPAKRRPQLVADRLVADVGGTSTRLALASGGNVLGDTAHTFRNDDFLSFEALLGVFTAKFATRPKQAVVAAAGKPSLGSIPLTNRDWKISNQVFLSKGIEDVFFLNDLEALAYATNSTTITFQGVHQCSPTGRQKLVVGIGTGFNLCPFRSIDRDRLLTFSSESGHMSLPSDITEVANLDGGRVRTVEDLFSGRGFRRVIGSAAGYRIEDVDQSEQVLKSNKGLAERVFRLYGRALGQLLRNLCASHLPYGGVFLAGSVARRIFSEQIFVSELLATPGNTILGDDWLPPISLFCQDDAALMGLAIWEPVHADISDYRSERSLSETRRT
ncbi:glucokinase [Pseudooceanicola nitratireducens]|uniref:glucokinase n=1 Tax=Pseudooceanicola nitratireducens TaxID=517719 RepID=UPI003C7AE1E4